MDDQPDNRPGNVEEPPENWLKKQEKTDNQPAVPKTDDSNSNDATTQDLYRSEQTAGQSRAYGSDKAGAAQTAGNDQSLYNPQKKDAKNKRGSSRRRLAMAGALSSILLIIGVFIFAVFFPALKVPQLAYHIEEYRLVRLTRTFYKQAAILATDRAAVDAAGINTDTIKDTQTGVKLAALRPQAVIDNMKASGILSFETTKNALGANKITAVKFSINGEQRTIQAPNYQFGRQINNYKQRLQFASQMNQAVHDSLRGNNYFVRSATSKKLLSGWGIRLTWYENKGAKYLGLTQDEADRKMLQDTTKAIRTTPTEGSKVGGVDKAAKEANQAIDDCEANPACGDKLLQTGELPPEVTSKIDGVVNTLNGKAPLPALIGFLNPIYQVGMPTCIVYDGSVSASKAFINSQNEAAVKAFLTIAKADSQQRQGDVTAQAVQAFNRRVGDIVNSNPERLARGQTIDTSSEVSPQAARSGEFTIFDAVFPAGPVSGAANFLASHMCPYVTDTGLNLTLAAANVIVAAFSLGSEQAVGDASGSVMSRVASSIAQKFSTVEGRATIKNTAKKYAASSAKTGAATEGATYLARMLVFAEMGAFYNGLGNDTLANQGDAGAVSYAQEMQRQQLYGRPLTNQEVALSQNSDNAYIAEQKNSKSTFEKFFALSNPDSAVSNVAGRVAGLKMTDVANFFLDIPHMFGNVFSSVTKIYQPRVLAAGAQDNTNYKVAQWGWSNDEQNLIDSDPSYDPLENAKILTSSGKADQIAQAYGECFTDDIGTLLTNGDVKRDQDGNVQDDGKCSPTNLGPKNPTYGDLVFRWRLDQSYQSTLQELLDIQNVSGG